jgi:4'-phosphopantetheinyl transferase
MGDASVDVWVRDTALGAAPPEGGRDADRLDPLDPLDQHERDRWARLADGPSARAYVELHVLARSQIGRFLGRSPESLRFDRTCPDCGRQHGRPLLVDDPGLHLSLSRAGTVVALALTRSGPVGVDVEQVAGTQFEGFGQVALHARERGNGGAVGGGVATANATAWVRKEAALKALGVGLRVEPASFVTPRAGALAEVVPGLPWVSVVDVDAPTGCGAAVALASGSGPLEVRHH